MKKAYVKWMDSRKGTVKGGRYNGCLVKITTKITAIPFAIMLLVDRWEVVDFKGDEERLKKEFDNWLNN